MFQRSLALGKYLTPVSRFPLWRSRLLFLGILGLALGSTARAELPEQRVAGPNTLESGTADEQFTVVVMDPLAAPLACDCVQGYAQRKYEVLGKFLEQKLGMPVRVVWGGALKTALKDSDGQADLIIGKHSVVEFDAQQVNIEIAPIAQLTGRDGKTTQTGLFVVKQRDLAQSVFDLRGYQILFGTESCAEKWEEPLRFLAAQGVEIAPQRDCFEACSEAASSLLETAPETRQAAVISSYAKPLLEGCGTIRKGDLRVVAETAEVPFITAFVNRKLPPPLANQVAEALLSVHTEPELMVALETKSGFVPWKALPDSKARSDSGAEQTSSTGKKN